MVGTTGYARNINNTRRNQVQYADVIKRQREGRGGERDDRHDSRHGSGGGGGGGGGAGSGEKGSATAINEISAIPKHYRKIAIKLSKMGSDDFDFDR